MNILPSKIFGTHAARRKLARISVRQAWVALGIALIVLNLASLIFAILVFRGAAAAPVAPAAPLPRVETLDRALLSDTIQKFRARAERFERLKSDPPIIPDPSR